MTIMITQARVIRQRGGVRDRNSPSRVQNSQKFYTL